MASLILLETPRSSPSSPTISPVILQDRESFNTSKSLTPKSMHMGRNSLHPLVSPPTTLINALRPSAALNAKSSVIFARTAVITNAEDAFGGDQDIPPLIAKQRIAAGEKKYTTPPNIDPGHTIPKQENNNGRPSTRGQEWSTSQIKSGKVLRNNQKSSI
jgi:hypothetical protein